MTNVQQVMELSGNADLEYKKGESDSWTKLGIARPNHYIGGAISCNCKIKLDDSISITQMNGITANNEHHSSHWTITYPPSQYNFVSLEEYIDPDVDFVHIRIECGTPNATSGPTWIHDGRPENLIENVEPSKFPINVESSRFSEVQWTWSLSNPRNHSDRIEGYSKSAALRLLGVRNTNQLEMSMEDIAQTIERHTSAGTMEVGRLNAILRNWHLTSGGDA
ncbi:hypothetical protein MMC12_004288 [Toensbergia leucococca]|nr:hypothetical protein [Toensbergia leucococca]